METNQLIQELGHKVQQLAQEVEQYRAESVVYDTRRDESERINWDKVYECAKASNRIHSNALTQQQSHKNSNSKEIKEHIDCLIGGQHVLMNAITASNTWDFHNGQESDERWEILFAFIKEQNKINDEIMAYLAKKDPTLLD